MGATAQQHAQSIGSNVAAYCAGADRVLLNLPLTPRLVESILETQRYLKALTSPHADLGVNMPGVTCDQNPNTQPFVQNIAGIRPVSIERGQA